VKRFERKDCAVIVGRKVLTDQVMNEILQGKGLVKVAEGKVLVTGMKGPLEEGWQRKVEAFAALIPDIPQAPTGESPP